MSKEAVFLDRDGVINNKSKKVYSLEEFELYPWTIDSIKKLKEIGYKVFVVTNQGGIELGYMNEKVVKRIHKHFKDLLAKEGTSVDDIIYCKHFDEPCEYKKPNPGMLLTLAEKHNVNLQKSFMVGDRKTDIMAGKKAGCNTIKVGDYYKDADYVCENLSEAVNYISDNKNEK